jgi:hypothetical protein
MLQEISAAHSPNLIGVNAHGKLRERRRRLSPAQLDELSLGVITWFIKSKFIYSI